MSAPRRLRLSRAKGWRKPGGAVVVARPTPWGNPFVVGQDGTAAECVHLYAMLCAGLLCFTTKADLDEQRAVLAHVREHVRSLAGCDLLCWCRLGQPCHAEVLLELANSRAPDLFRFFLPLARRAEGDGDSAMPDPDLHGNHDACPACALRRETQGAVPIDHGSIACNRCGGKGYLPLAPAEIVRRTVAEARRLRWPDLHARFGGDPLPADWRR